MVKRKNHPPLSQNFHKRKSAIQIRRFLERDQAAPMHHAARHPKRRARLTLFFSASGRFEAAFGRRFVRRVRYAP
jgi:hypothetical protein